MTRSRLFGTRRGRAALGLSALLVLATSTAGAAGGLWNITSIGAPVSADGITIAVIDTGVQANHPALAGRVLPQKDFVGDGRKGDPDGHGTHVAGSAAGGSIDCGVGIGATPIGVAPTARIRPVRVLDAEGNGTVGDVAAGIRWAADSGAQVINLSLGPEVGVTNLITGGGSLVDAIEYAWKKGSVTVLAAGNDELLGALGSGYGDIPAIVVTATTQARTKAYYATAVGGAKWGIAAPGGDGSGKSGDILSSYPGDRCAYLAGTSMATPHVAGAVAALRARGLGPEAAVKRILATADDIGSPSTYGAGLLNVGKAIGSPSAPATTPPTTVPAVGPAPAAPSSPSVDPTTLDPPAGDDEGSTTSGDGSTTTSAESDPTTTTTADEGTTSTTETGDDETAAGKSQVRDESSGQVGAPLAVGAGAAVLALWALTGRTALLLRR